MTIHAKHGQTFIVALMLAACGGTENAFVADDGSSSEGDLGKSVAAATYTIGKSNVKDWYLCGQEGSSTCRAGDGGRYMAFGANGQFVFNDLPAGPVLCAKESFGLQDPAPGVVKSCFMSGLSRYALPGQTRSPQAAFGSHGLVLTAMGGGNHAGYFVFDDYPSDATLPLSCPSNTQGYPIAQTEMTGCYQELVGYTYGAKEGESFKVGNNAPVAMGQYGTFSYTKKSGTITCDWSKLFGQDPVPGKVKYCFFLTASSSAVPVPEGGWVGSSYGVAFTSGYFSNVITLPLSSYRSLYCSNSTFGGDPEPGQAKSCYPIPSPIIY